MTNREKGQGGEPAGGNRALQFFTDRHDFTKLLAEYLNEERPREKILFFYGDGGNGKTLLLKFLREKCCKRLSPATWLQLQNQPAREVAERIEQETWDCTPVPAVLHDFGLQPIGDDGPQDPFYGLLMLRRTLTQAAEQSQHSLKFPLYDFACVWYLHKRGKSAEQIKQLFPLSEATGLIGSLIDAVTQKPIGSLAAAVINILNSWLGLGEKFNLYLLKRNLTEKQVQEILSLDPDPELINELPELLARDLNEAMRQDWDAKPPRLVLFFDSHDAFWRENSNSHLPSQFFFQDQWLRRLLTELDLKAGIVVAVAGREKPRWAEAIYYPISETTLDTQLVWHLSDADAHTYLQNVGIQDQRLRESLIKYASVESNQVHPLLLSMCADVVLEAANRGTTVTPADFPNLPEMQGKFRELIAKLLSYADEEVYNAVGALRACRAFNSDIYFMLADQLRFNPTNASFDQLTRFSFVWETERPGWYRIHKLVRRLNSEKGDITQKAHKILESHYRKKKNLPEAIYHAICLDWERGVADWLKALDNAVSWRNVELCQKLLEIKQEIGL
jgi:hypothetical protein